MSPPAEAVIVAAARSPIGRAFKGSLTQVRPEDLTATIVRAALSQLPQLDPTDIEDLYLGTGEPYDEQGANLARRVAVHLGLDGVPGATVTRFCASSLQTIRMAFHAIRAGEGDVFVAAGVECVSRYADPATAGIGAERFMHPAYQRARARTAAIVAGEASWRDPQDDGQLPDIYITMGQTAENVAALRSVSREDQDRFAVESQRRAERAIADGFYRREITPITLDDGIVVGHDDGPRPGTTYDKVEALKPVFREHGTVTAGNCCSLNDGAAALVVMSDFKAKTLGITPLARIVSTGVSALSPEIMGLGPVHACRRALARAGMTIDDVDLVEINEAFAAQVIPCAQDLGIDHAKLNVNGGAIALGHPFGMTGARIATTLINGLRERDQEIGLETMCVGGGQGMAMILERLS